MPALTIQISGSCRTRLHCWLVVHLSYTRGADVPLLEKTISQALQDAAAKFWDREALIVRHQSTRLTWRELNTQVTRAARGLAGLGFRPDSHPPKHRLRQPRAGLRAGPSAALPGVIR